MATWGAIWRQSIGACQRLCRERTRGELDFLRLLQRSADDPMVHYERGEAYEHINEPELALSDYSTAAANFTDPRWRKVATQGTLRVHSRADCDSQLRLTTDSFTNPVHEMHRYPELPHSVLADAIAAVSRLQCEPRLSAVQLRVCLEMLLKDVASREHLAVGRRPKLSDLIAMLSHLIPKEVIPGVWMVKDVGDRAAHDPGVITPKELTPNEFMAFAGWYCELRRLEPTHDLEG